MCQVDLYNQKIKETDSYVKSPLNYIGGKYKYLDELLPLFPEGIDTMVDVFGGGFNVGINTDANRIIYNDMLTPVVELFQYWSNHGVEYTLNYINKRINEYGLSKTDKPSFNKFRRDYNSGIVKCPLDLFILGAFSFNHQLRWNNQHEYNSSHGTNRSSYNPRLQKNLTQFIEKLHTLNITYYNRDFRELPYDELTEKDFCYFDPPYLITTGNYNDGNRGFKNWNKTNETELYNLLDKLDENKVRWGITNTPVHDGKENNFLKDWMTQYNIYDLNTDYSNSNYHKKTRNQKENKEVYITNVQI